MIGIYLRFCAIALVTGGGLFLLRSMSVQAEAPVVEIGTRECARFVEEKEVVVRLELAVLALAQQWEWPLHSPVIALRSEQIAQAAGIDCKPNCAQMGLQQECV